MTRNLNRESWHRLRFMIGQHDIKIPIPIIHYKNLSPSAKILYGVLVYQLNQYQKFRSPEYQQGENTPNEPVTINLLAKEMNISRQQISSLLKSLICEGFIEVTPPSGRNRLEHSPNKYHFIWHPCFEED